MIVSAALLPMIRPLLAALAIVALVAGAWWAKSRYDESLREEGRQEVRAAWNEEVRIAQRAEDEKRAAMRAAEEKADEEHRQALAAADAAAGAARDAAGRLQQRVDALVAAARRGAGQSAPAAGRGPGQQDPDPIGVLADVLGRADARAGILAEYATALHAAGLRCERHADAVTDLQLSPSTGAGTASPGAP